jgi:hypothetical protein
VGDYVGRVVEIISEEFRDQPSLFSGFRASARASVAALKEDDRAAFVDSAPWLFE